MKNKKNLIDEKFNDDGEEITENMIEEDSKEVPPSMDIPQHLTPYEVRDMYYSTTLSHYNSEYKERRKQIKLMRDVMFWVMLALFAAVIICSIILFFIIICRGVNNTSDIVSLISVLISFITTTIAIPKIMAKSLFPEKEDGQIVQILTKLIENDDNIRKNNH